MDYSTSRILDWHVCLLQFRGFPAASFLAHLLPAQLNRQGGSRMGTINKVLLIGRLGKDPEDRTTAGGTRVSNFRMATDTYHGGNGEKTTEWHRIVVFGKVAELCNQFLKKGRLVCVEGSLQTRCWEKSPGEKHYFTEIVASRVTFLGSREQDVSHSNASDSATEIPF